MAAFESGRQFQVDNNTTQIFYREPVNGVYSQWTPLPPSDYHRTRPETHNVRKFVSVICSADFGSLVVGLDPCTQ